MKKQLLNWLAMAAVALLIAGAAAPRARAQEQTQQASPPQQQADTQQQQDSQTPDQGGPGVARVSFIHGDVTSQRGDSGDHVAVTLNTPVVAGDTVSTGDKSRAEVQFDYANILRMADNVSAKIAALDRTHIQVQVAQGLVTYSVLKGSEADAEIDTPNVAVYPQGEGEYRILVNSAGETQVVVRKGAADVSTQQGSTKVESGQLITIEGTDNPQYKIADAPGRDDWDKWSNDRDHMISSAESWRHVNHDYVGAGDLDSYGTWSEIPDYGSVWTPAQDPGWAPYRDGRWVWEPYYGWTWVGYEPWGWAPYHYGRWFVNDGSWCWWPGPVFGGGFYDPIWAPAYVSFFGWGGGFGFGFGGGFGRVGWLALGPGDFCHPWWGRDRDRFDFVNNRDFGNFRDRGFRPLMPGPRGISNMRLAESNGRVRGGLTSMAGNEFGRGRISPHQEHMDAATFRGGRMMTGGLPVTPTRESLSPSGRFATGNAARGNIGSQRFFTHTRPGPAQTPFREDSARVQRAIDSSRNGAGTQPQNGRFGSQGSAQQSGAPGNSQRTFEQQGRQPVQSSRPGWHTFTPPSGSDAHRGPSPVQGSSRQFSAPSGANPRGPGGNNSGPRNFSQPPARTNPSAPSSQRDGWQRFSAPPRPANAPSGPRGGGATTSRPNSPYSGGSRNFSRPPLQMQRPIVTPRYSSPGYSSPRNSSPRYSAPSYSRPAPSYRGPSGGGGRPSFSRPSGGGSRPSGGGGHPGGGGSRSSGGGGSRPSGGGSHPSGGGGHPGGGSPHHH